VLAFVNAGKNLLRPVAATLLFLKKKKKKIWGSNFVKKNH